MLTESHAEYGTFNENTAHSKNKTVRYVCVLYVVAAAVTFCNMEFVPCRTYVYEYIKYVNVGVVHSVMPAHGIF